MADFLVAEDGRCLSLLLVHLQTPELWRKCAEHNWMSFVMIPWRERSLEACLTAYLNYPGMIHAHPHVVPQPVDSYYNVYSLCRLMEQMTAEKFTCGRWRTSTGESGWRSSASRCPMVS